MVSGKQHITYMIEAQSDGLNAYIGSLVRLIDAMSKIIDMKDNTTPEVMELQRIRAEMDRQLDCATKILDELWTDLPIETPPTLCE